MRRVDVAIVGAGPAGAAVALFLAERGLDVALLDRAAFPRDKVCGEAIGPGALPVLRRLGVLDEVLRLGAWPFRGARLMTPDGLFAEAPYPGAHRGLAFPRMTLDWLLVQRASARVDLRLETSVVSVEPRAEGFHLRVRARGQSEETLWAWTLVSAEGRHARLFPVQRASGPARRFAVVATLEGVSELSDWLELHLLEPGFQVVVSAQAPTRAVIAAVLDGADSPARAQAAIKDFLALVRRDPLMQARLRHAQLLKPPRGMALDRYRPERLSGAGWLLVGDAVGSLDPITGEGMTRAFRTAELAAQTLDQAFEGGDLSADSLAGYSRAVHAEFDPCTRFVDAVVAMGRRPRLARMALRAMARDPVLAGRMGAFQGGLSPPEGFFAPGTLGRMVWAGARSALER